MTRMLLRWLINAVAVFAAVSLVPGLHGEGLSWGGVALLGLILGLLNALVRPLLKLLTCPLIVLTLGLFTLVINTAIFWLAGEIGAIFGAGYTGNSLLSYFLGALVVSAVSVVLTLLLKDELEGRKK